MGTEYYIKDKTKEMNQGIYIGKRSAAGKFCYKCRMTLHRGGPDMIHTVTGQWAAACMKCNSNDFVSPAMSFTFNINLPDLCNTLVESGYNLDNDLCIVGSNSEKAFSFDEFIEGLKECAITFNS